MIAGRAFWVAVWIGILGLGILGLLPAIQWARQTRWRNLDEVLRGAGTVLVSVGMLILLQEASAVLGSVMLVLALILFVMAYVVGSRHDGETGSGL